MNKGKDFAFVMMIGGWGNSRARSTHITLKFQYKALGRGSASEGKRYLHFFNGILTFL